MGNSMGECSFGQSFGQADPQRAPPKDMDGIFWRSVPRAIFQHQSNKYGVRPPSSIQDSLYTNTDRLSFSEDFPENLESTGNLIGPQI